ncbi:DUF4350 domain-containing protein [Ereboglobus luteus]|nr:DUF4350 domain-containing protein [Ereboglobus luteus]
MKRRASMILLAALVVLLLGGIAELLRMRISRGDVYPLYSTYRADPLGTKAFYESLELVPGARAQRWLREPEKLPAGMRGTIVFAGVNSAGWLRTDRVTAKKLDSLARGGARVVVTFKAGFGERELKRWRDSRTDDDYSKYNFAGAPDFAAHALEKRDAPEVAPEEKPEPPEKKGSRKKQVFVDAGEQWGVKIVTRIIKPDDDGRLPPAVRSEGQPGEWPGRLDWMSELYFDTDKSADWRVLYTREGRPVMIERAIGTGSIVLAADSFFLSNEALQRARATSLLAWLVTAPGGDGVVVFDEYHLGMTEDHGVAALARRYGLTGAACLAMLLAVLWVWHRMALFVPPPADEDDEHAGYEPTAGLEALLRRSVPRAQVARVCLDEWKKTASPADIARVDKALATLERNASPWKIYTTAREALRKSGGVLPRPK